MRISISQRFKPFVQRPGVPMLVPGTNLVAVPYPMHIELADGVCLATGLQGPATTFFVCQDLEKGRLRAWGKGANGYFRWDLYPQPDRRTVMLCRNTPKVEVHRLGISERLSLGCHRQLDWDLVRRRHELREILPVWLRLGQITPAVAYTDGPSLLSDLQEVIVGRRRSEVAPLLLALFRAGFEGILVPHETDALSWGYGLPPVPEGGSPLALLTLGASLVRSLFIHDTGEVLSLLPLVPPELVSGRLTGALCRFGELDLEWSKRALRRVVLRASREAQVFLELGSSIRMFRLRRHKNDIGERLDAKTGFTVSEGEVLWLDRFER